jgi:hypothetical protein
MSPFSRNEPFKHLFYRVTTGLYLKHSRDFFNQQGVVFPYDMDREEIYLEIE